MSALTPVASVAAAGVAGCNRQSGPSSTTPMLSRRALALHAQRCPPTEKDARQCQSVRRGALVGAATRRRYSAFFACGLTDACAIYAYIWHFER